MSADEDYILYVIKDQHGKEFYGFRQKTLTYRWDEWVKAAKAGRRGKLLDAIRELGEHAFKIEEVTRCGSRKTAIALKRELILKNGSEHPNGYNVSVPK